MLRFAPSRVRHLAVCALSLSALLSAATSQQDLDKDLRAKDAATREAAVRRVAADGGEGAEKRLLAALKDKDWSVLVAALDGLRAHGSRDAVRPLLQMAQEGPFALARERAAVALAAAAPEAGVEALYDALRGKGALAALPALAATAAAGARPKDVARLERLLQHEDPALRTAAARAWIACAAPEARGAAWSTLAKGADLAQQAAALELLASLVHERDLKLLVTLLQDPTLPPALERRALAATRAGLLSVLDEGARAERFTATVLTGLGKGAAGRMRLARLFASEGGSKLLPAERARASLTPLLGDSDPDVRAAAAHALARLGGESGSILGLLEGEGDARVRAIFVRAAVALGAAATAEGEAALAARLRTDSALTVREAAALGLGRAGAGAPSVEALSAALGDRDWEVAVAAAIALGRTRADAALPTLTALARHTDWRLRGAAALGLFYIARAEVVPPLLSLLEDAHASVAATAQRGLAIHAGREAEAQDRKALVAWWKDNLQRARFQTPDEVRARRDRFGYTVPDREIYRGLDVMVVPGRGDQMESVLQRLGIEHRVVQAGHLGTAGVHPFGILIAGCTGELEARDLDVVRWCVRAGGALFTSCWALTYTVEASFPGLVTKFQTPGEVLDRVRATPVAQDSPYLTGVFDGGVVPIYELQGAHLIQVLDPERVEVLVDSPEAALRHGSGVLAAWFRVGHGVVLDSVNHFDLQGLELATHLKQPEELMGYAVDHMGLSLERLREVQGAAWWKSRAKAAKEVDDLSAFRILTNFVREKRMNGT